MPTYPREPYWPASAQYALAPFSQNVQGNRLASRPIPVELGGDLPGTYAYPAPRGRESGAAPAPIAGQIPFRSISTNLPAPSILAVSQQMPDDDEPTVEWGTNEIELPPMIIEGDVPPPTSIPTTPPKEEPKKGISTGWIVAGSLVGLVAVGGIVYLGTRAARRGRRRR